MMPNSMDPSRQGMINALISASHITSCISHVMSCHVTIAAFPPNPRSHSLIPLCSPLAIHLSTSHHCITLSISEPLDHWSLVTSHWPTNWSDPIRFPLILIHSLSLICLLFIFILFFDFLLHISLLGGDGEFVGWQPGTNSMTFKWQCHKPLNTNINIWTELKVLREWPQWTQEWILHEVNH